MNTVEMLKAYVREASTDVGEKMPLKIARSIMVANNRILAAAIIENGGKLLISPDAVFEMLTNNGHVVAVSNEDGSLTVTLASKEEILAKSDVMAL